MPHVARLPPFSIVLRSRPGSARDAADRHALVGAPDTWEMKRAFQLAFLRSVGLETHHFVLDIGCGTLRGGIPLIDYLEPGHYVGIEVRANVLAEARAELRASALESKRAELLLVPELRTLDLAWRFDHVWAFSLLFHLDDAEVSILLAAVRRHLAPRGVFHANVSIGSARHDDWQGFPVIDRPLAFYEQACRAVGLRATELGPLSALGHRSGRPWQDRQVMLRIAPSEG